MKKQTLGACQRVGLVVPSRVRRDGLTDERTGDAPPTTADRRDQINPTTGTSEGASIDGQTKALRDPSADRRLSNGGRASTQLFRSRDTALNCDAHVRTR